jgi:two-component SAPR family response regulator
MLSTLCGSAAESAGGLLFTSSKEKVDKRTSLDIFSDKLQKFENNVSISFDLSIWDSSQFGHIFRVINNRKQEVEFVFVNFYGTDRMYLDFHSPITHKSVQIPITQEEIDRKATLHFVINFDLQADKASIILHDSVYVCSPVGLENPSFLLFAFGLYGLNLDVPELLIKNLRIVAEKDKMFFFPLNESEGGFACDSTGEIVATVRNPQWIINRHFYWQTKAAFAFRDKVNISYDKLKNHILIVDKDSVLCFDPRYDRVSRFKLDIDQGYIDNRMKNDFLHSNVFYSAAGDLYRFGGYANHTYSNQISIYNKEMNIWDPLDFRGSEITPRFYSALGDGVNVDEKLIFGGFGNETGKQEHGGHNLYDLHLLNLNQRTITHLWTLKTIPDIEFIPGNNLILSGDKKSFYALCYAHHIPKTAGYLYRFDLQNGDFSVMSDSISFTSEDMNTSVHLFYNSELNEFYAVVRDLTDKDENRVQIFSLLSPPILKAQLKQSVHLQKSYKWLFLAAIVLTVFVGIYIIRHFISGKKKRMERHKLIEAPLLPHENKYDRKQKQSAAYIFGSFTVYNRKGTDISYRFSLKLKTLFSLILLNTNGETGITAENLNLTLWPDKDMNEAKNIRGVTINRLRGCIEDINGITLVHQNHQYFFVFEQPFYCDWLEYSDIMQALQATAEQKQYDVLMDQLIDIVYGRKFLVSIWESVMDNYKSKEEEKLENLLRNYMIRLYSDKQYRKVISTASTFFAIDPLDAEILNICIKSYEKLGRKEEAKAFLKNYNRTHKMLTGEE